MMLWLALLAGVGVAGSIAGIIGVVWASRLLARQSTLVEKIVVPPAMQAQASPKTNYGDRDDESEAAIDEREQYMREFKERLEEQQLFVEGERSAPPPRRQPRLNPLTQTVDVVEEPLDPMDDETPLTREVV